MKHKIISVFSFILLSTVFVPMAKAETVEVTPFQLISLAQDGYLEDQGIPKGNLLVDEYQSGRITAEEIVQAAIKDNRLTEDTLSNQEYLRAVREQIQEQFDNDSDNH
ncbi:hypothetical protein IFO70_24205 [Phormidium tenue FACHB-886]|nr:hypothetical protein [Phormidium tenue FACHB-886]